MEPVEIELVLAGCTSAFGRPGTNAVPRQSTPNQCSRGSSRSCSAVQTGRWATSATNGLMEGATRKAISAAAAIALV